MTIERIKEGLKAARIRGKTGSRPFGLRDNAIKTAVFVWKLYQDKLSIIDIMKKAGVGKGTIYKYIKMNEEDLK